MPRLSGRLLPEPFVNTSLLAAAALAFAAAAPVAAQPVPKDPSAVSIGQLKDNYLACERMAMRGALDSRTAAVCSAYYEALLKRGFDGDFDRMFAWWRNATAPRGFAGG